MSYIGLGVPAWRALGLTVGTGYAFFGIFEVFKPFTMVRLLMDTPPKPSRETESTISVLGPLLGARDLSIAASIFALYRMGRDREMGVVIVAGTILCYADATAIWLFKSPWLAVQFVGGATVWAGIGMGLIYASSASSLPGQAP